VIFLFICALNATADGADKDVAEWQEVRIEVAGEAAWVYVEEFAAGPTPLTVRLRPGDRIRIATFVHETSPTYNLDYALTKRHLCDQEEVRYSLTYPYGGESLLRFRRDQMKMWYQLVGEEETPVGIETEFAKDPKATLSKVLNRKPPYLWVKLHAAQAAELAPLLKGAARLGLHVRFADEASLTALAGLENVEILSLAAPYSNHGKHPSALKSIAPLASMTKLRVLELQGVAQLSDLSPLAGLTLLRSLDLVLCRQAKDLTPLAHLKSLENVSLPPETTDEQLAALCATHPGLLRLSLHFCEALTTLEPLESLPKLESLCLEWCRKMKDVSSLAALKKLRMLAMAPTPTVDQDLAMVSRELPQLQRLSLAFTGVRDLTPLAALDSLTWLSLYKVSGGGHDIAPLAGLTRLASLDLTNMSIKDYSPLAGLTALRNLVLFAYGGGHRTLSDLGVFSELKALEHLSLMGCPGVKDLSLLSGLVEMKGMSLRGTGVNDLGALRGMRDLRYLDIRECKDVDIRALFELKNLWIVRGIPRQSGGEFRKAVSAVKGNWANESW
jgi:internalin A